MDDIIYAPFTEAQVIALNEYQNAGRYHPFTCLNHRDDNHKDEPLIASRDGWYCLYCDYKQTWAHRFMGEGRTDISLGDRISFFARLKSQKGIGEIK